MKMKDTHFNDISHKVSCKFLKKKGGREGMVSVINLI